MRTPLVLLLLSLVGLAVALGVPALSDLVLLAGPMVVASLYLLLRARHRAAPKPQWVIIDGSNVMHWIDNTPDIAPVRAVAARLQALGYTPGVVFDANAGYLLRGKYQHDHALGKLLGLPGDHVMVVDKGTVADTVLLAAARDMGARVVSNDRFRDWAAEFPEVRQPGFLIRGSHAQGVLHLDVDATVPGQRAPAPAGRAAR